MQVRPVHRLDRDTSGLMLFAITPQAELELERMFARHAIDRRYLAIVHGTIRETMTIESHFIRDRGDGLRGSIPPNAPVPDDAQRALTHVIPIESFTSPAGDAYTIVECRLETGRTHQIRIHLAEAGHRLCGEKTYNKPTDGKPLPDPSNCPRQALHSYRCAFDHPITLERLRFESKLPKDLKTWLDRLREA
ncbi:MAG: RluA family pseudouridine synthase [Tepidisphaeraceae bacterium]